VAVHQHRTIDKEKPMTILFAFPGQGSQSLGMGKAFAESFLEAREVFEEVDEALGQNLSAIIWGDNAEALTNTANAQPAIMAVSIAAVRVAAKQLNLRMASGAFIAGHSLGEYSALCAAGALSLADTARLLRVRGNAMQAAAPKGFGAMAAVLGMPLEKLQAILAASKDMSIANDNSPGQVVISGAAEAFSALTETLKAAGAKRVVSLNVSAPFHSHFMEPAARIMAEALNKTLVRTPTPALIANVHAHAVTDPQAIRDGLVAQVCGTVRWRESLLYAVAHGVMQQVELGNGKVLAGLAKQTIPDVRCFSIGSLEDLDAYSAMAL
jgi:[acyl-carrier-protein] S-malonyltransferase